MGIWDSSSVGGVWLVKLTDWKRLRRSLAPPRMSEPEVVPHSHLEVETGLLCARHQPDPAFPCRRPGSRAEEHLERFNKVFRCGEAGAIDESFRLAQELAVERSQTPRPRVHDIIQLSVGKGAVYPAVTLGS